MIKFLQLIFLAGGFYYSYLVHKKLNTITKEDFVITPSSVSKEVNNIEKSKREEKKSNFNNLKKNISTKIDEEIVEEKLEDKVVVKQKSQIHHKEKIKEVKKDTSKKKENINNINEENTCEDEELVYLMTLERLSDIENNEEDKEFLKNKIAFEKQLEVCVCDEISDEIPINYSALFSQENKKKISEEIIQNTDLKWYEQNADGSSIEKILPKEDFKVEEYTF